jgi:hypothetical protein
MPYYGQRSSIDGERTIKNAMEDFFFLLEKAKDKTT